MEYSKYIVTFIDVMGFKNLVEKRFEGDPKPIQKILKTISETNSICNKRFTSGGLKKEVKTHIFSDSIIRRIRIENKPDKFIVESLDLELFQLALMQIALLDEGVFIRGCINIGPMYARQDVFFGPAFHEAYKFESKEAVNPIIVLAPSVVDLITSFPHYRGHEIPSVIDSPDMKYNHSHTYLNYLYLIKSHLILSDKKQVEEFFINHRDRVKDEISRNADNVQVLMKYLWLKELHNHYVPQMKPFANRDDLLIK